MKNTVFAGLVWTSLLFGWCSDPSATNSNNYRDSYRDTYSNNYHESDEKTCEEPSVLWSEWEFIKSEACKKLELDIKIRIAKAHLKEKEHEKKLRDKSLFCDDQSKWIDSAWVYWYHDCSYSWLEEDQPYRYEEEEKVEYNPWSISISISN
jgi:hypothetical protein